MRLGGVSFGSCVWHLAEVWDHLLPNTATVVTTTITAMSAPLLSVNEVDWAPDAPPSVSTALLP